MSFYHLVILIIFLAGIFNFKMEEDLIDALKVSYFQWKCNDFLIKDLEKFVQDSSETDLARFQSMLVEIFDSSDSGNKFTVEPEFSFRFWKRMAKLFELRNLELAEELYGLMLQKPDMSDLERKHFKTYFFDNYKIRLCETKNVVSEGTTGLRTWNAAIFLLKFLTEKNSESLLKADAVLELGSGLGFVGIALLKSGLFKGKFFFTDCHPKVLEILEYNCKANDLNPDSYEIVRLDWEQFNEADAEKLQPDLVIGSDIVYDDRLLDSLVNCLKLLKRNVLIASTIRNKDTVDKFRSKVEQCFDVEEVENDTIVTEEAVSLIQGKLGS